MSHTRLPEQRKSITRKFSIPMIKEDGVTLDKLKFYVIAGVYADGKLGEIFIHADKVGSFVSGMLDGFAVVFSLGLQHGIPLETLTSKLRHTKFEPNGFLPKDPDIKSCSSALDLITNWLDLKFGEKKTEALAAV